MINLHCAHIMKSNDATREGLAIRRALGVLKEHGFQNTVLAFDRLSIIHRISFPARDRSLVGTVVNDIKIHAEDFSLCSFKHVSRNLNVVAHRLARSSEHSICYFSLDVISECIRAELCNDVIWSIKSVKKKEGVLWVHAILEPSWNQTTKPLYLLNKEGPIPGKCYCLFLHNRFNISFFVQHSARMIQTNAPATSQLSELCMVATRV
jgi:hypothetical protein